MKIFRVRKKKVLAVFIISLGALSFSGFLVFFMPNISIHLHAETIDQLQQKIDEHNNSIKQLQQEIGQYKEQINQTTSQETNLQNTLQVLDITGKKLGKNIQLTQQQIDTTNLTLSELQQEISSKEQQMKQHVAALAETMRSIDEIDSSSLLENLLTYKDVSTLWTQVETTNQFQSKIKNDLVELKTLKNALEQNSLQTQTKKTDLVSFQSQLSDQQTLVQQNVAQKNQLLNDTKDKEANYRKILADKIAKKQAFDRELIQFEAQLKFAVDPGSYPASAPGVLSWPLAEHIITQYFGNTSFSQEHAALYNGHGHNGIDLAAAPGTPIMAAQSGVIEGTGDTDLVCPGASFGRWVLIRHNNGLSTLYAHLSLIKAVPGDTVSTGDVIGYSGTTGYATGPHLHFTVYATQGVRIMKRQSAVCAGAYTMPIADLKAYLNPLSYL